MRLNFKYFILIFFVILLLSLLLPKTTINICEVCGVQEYERSIFGKTIELISEREVDEFKTHAKWIDVHGQPHSPHIWKEVNKSTKELLTH